MYSNAGKGFVLVILVLFYAPMPCAKAENTLSLADKVGFTVHPQQCVTLRQGRDCFATITIEWRQTAEQSFCLYQLTNKQDKHKKQLKCWSADQDGLVTIAFESSTNVTYQLRNSKNDHVIGEAEVVVSWLHKSTARKRRWRLF
jgi:hypothetical protein